VPSRGTVELSTATLLEGLAATHRRVGRLLAGLPPDAWALTVPATPAWSVAEVAAHLTAGDQAALAVAQGLPWDGPSRADGLDAWTAAGVAGHAGEDRETLLAGYRAAADALRRHLAGLEQDAWPARVTFVAGPVTLRTLAQLRLHDAWLHGHDVAAAAGQPFEADAVSLAWMADLAARVVPSGLSRRGRPHPGTAIRVVLAPAGEWLVAGAAGERPAPDAEPDLTIEAEPLAFVLRAAGRATGDPWRATGDPALAADLAATLHSVS
jgi:uncharacterized protein (TIGR03083 family)